MKKYIARIVVMLLIASVLPLQVSAAEKESIELAVEAEQVGVSLTLPQSVSGNILSLQVGLKVDSNVQEETTATFQFSENVAKVADYRYNQERDPEYLSVRNKDSFSKWYRVFETWKCADQYNK